MSSITLQTQAAAFLKARPEVRPGYTVRVHERIQEGNKERVQVFEGLVISVHKGHVPTDQTFTVRRIASGIGVEKVFSLHSPKIEKIEIKKVAKIRRAKLFFLRGRRGKAARLSERFTTSDEFAVATPVAEAQEPDVEEVTEPVVEEKNENVKKDSSESEDSNDVEEEKAQGETPAAEEASVSDAEPKEEEKKEEASEK